MTGSQRTLDSLRSRLSIHKLDEQSCKAAILGKQIPQWLGYTLSRLCVIRGIRHHDGFGRELYKTLPEFARALNARSIMSNRIPEIESAQHQTLYCFWYPDVPSEDTLRKLAKRYKHMRYLVGRCCAVAGYTKLYFELDLLPEIHIAEEARECGSLEIYNAIMSKEVRYQVLNDYTRTISAVPRAGARLNGDTAVASSLQHKQEFYAEPEMLFPGFKQNTFNITEDMNVDLANDKTPLLSSSSDCVLELLLAPLPDDLPCIDKDLLILMAAYHGNIDRYARLRRPEFVPYELECCIRGIFHNTMFALWWRTQERQMEQDGKDSLLRTMNGSISRAISARMIMNNVLDRMMSKKHRDPYLIWYPSIAAESTYRELYRIRPSMAPQILRTCMAGGYKALFEHVLSSTVPDKAVMAHAKKNGGIYLELLEQRLDLLNRKAESLACHETWKHMPISDLLTTSSSLWEADVRSLGTTFDGLYERYACNAGAVEMLLSMPEPWRQLPRDDLSDLDYVEWPPAIALDQRFR